jgi:hypothetical protein
MQASRRADCAAACIGSFSSASEQSKEDKPFDYAAAHIGPFQPLSMFFRTNQMFAGRSANRRMK